MEVEAPIYILKGSEQCWGCKKPTSVYAFGGFIDKKFKVLNYIDYIPDGLKKIFEDKRLKFRFSKTDGTSYFMNTCEFCGAPQGDFFLHLEPDGDFFSVSESTAKKTGFVIKKDGVINIGGRWV